MPASRSLPVGLLFLFSLGCQLQVTSPLLDSAAAGANECPNGGQTIRTGNDGNGDGVLSDDEVTSSVNVCFPASAVGGGRTLATLTTTPSAACSTVELSVGADDNTNDVLDPAEIDDTDSVCIAPPTELNTQVSSFEGRVASVESRFQNMVDVQLAVNPDAAPDGRTTFQSLSDALDFARTVRKSQNIEIVLEPRTYVLNAPIRLEDLDGAHLEITGGEGGETVLQFQDSDGFILRSGFHLGILRQMKVESLNTSGQPYRGLQVGPGSRMDIENVEFVNFTYGVEIVGGHVTRPAYLDNIGLFSTKSMVVRCNPSDGFSVGVWIRDGGRANAANTDVFSCLFGYWVQNGSTGLFDASVADGNLLGFFADHRSFVQANQREADGQRSSVVRSREAGWVSANNSAVNALGWIPPTGADANTNDMVVRDGSTLRIVEDLGFGAAVDCGTVICDPSAILRGCSGNVTCNAAIR